MKENVQNRKKLLWIGVGVAVVLLGVVLALMMRKPNHTDIINILDPQPVLPEKRYDLEKTVRVLNGLEKAQGQLSNFEEYHNYMAHQDYTGVPDDVLEARDLLMPIMQRIHDLQIEYNNVRLWSSLVPKLSGNLVGEIRPRDLTLLITDPKIGGLNVMKMAANGAFKIYEEDQNLKSELKEQIGELKAQYLDYLENSFLPVYSKYMQEWDRLCLDRDKAYIALYRKKPDQVLEYSDLVLKNYPENREALLLKAMGLIQYSRWKAYEEPLQFTIEKTEVAMKPREDSLLNEAQKTIEFYKNLYPEQSAPAFLLEGLLSDYKGNHSKALVLYDKSAQEYPRQAEQLASTLELYRIRQYLNNSVEGVNLLTLYKSIMLGLGYFSPNFMKAMYYEQNGDLDNCSQELYYHFFRRGNQDVYDGMLMDMHFCEEIFPNSFNRLLPERNYINLSFKMHKWRENALKKSHYDPQKIDVTIENQSDIVLTDLRIFLCIHFTDMVDGDYHIVKIPSIGRINPHSSYEIVNPIGLSKPGKEIKDIAEMRAIAMIEINQVTKICWVDNIYNTTDEDAVKDFNKAHDVDFQKLSVKLDDDAIRERDAYLEGIKMSDDTFRKLIKENTKVSMEGNTGFWGWLKDDRVLITLPSDKLDQLTPTFKWNKKLMPEKYYREEGNIHLSFKTSWSKISEENVLYMTSDYLNYAIYFEKVDENSIKVKSVENLASK